ncbi:MAG TPA: alpha/beta hydrolase [Tepidisphaeraceae bacterium]|nr:alpha/beta hydrolase [Tepidisphaeraceae bacterium]
MAKPFNGFAIAGILLIATSLTATRAADAPAVIDIWPAGKVPGNPKEPAAEKMEDSGGVKRVSNVSKPTLTVFRPAKDKDTGAAVVICPGGGYSILAWDLEGTEVAQWLNSAGVTGIILKYRVPAHYEKPHGFAPLVDAQRAMSLVRSNAKEWGIDPTRIGMLGFSAGGNLTALACTNYDKRSYDPIDDIDQASCRPDFGVLCYPAWLIDDKTHQLKDQFRVNKKTPPMFFVHAGDDGITADNSAVMYMALHDAKLPAELHIYSKGGHGFGLRPTDKPVSTWPKRCEAWMKSLGLLKARVDH